MAYSAAQQILGEPLATKATVFFKKRGLTLNRAIKMWVQDSLDRADSDYEMPLEEINDIISLTRAERDAKTMLSPMPKTHILPNGSSIRCAPENCTAEWLSQFAKTYKNKATNALAALEKAPEIAEENGTADMSLEEIDAEIAAYRAGA